MNLETIQTEYKVLKSLGSDSTALVFSGASQTVDKHEDRHSSITTADIQRQHNAALIIFHGDHASAPENKTMTWTLYGWATGGPAEHIAAGTATLGTQRVATGTATEMYADTIAITSQTWPVPISVLDSGNNRVAKLALDLCGIAHLGCHMTNNSSSSRSTGCKVRFF